eukprot:3131716-Lingulodinium_polyedra.AAC.1
MPARRAGTGESDGRARETPEQPPKGIGRKGAAGEDHPAGKREKAQAGGQDPPKERACPPGLADTGKAPAQSCQPRPTCGSKPPEGESRNPPKRKAPPPAKMHACGDMCNG